MAIILPTSGLARSVSFRKFGKRISTQSSIAAHSMAEPLAIAKNRPRSDGETFPEASAILRGIEI